MKAQNQPITLVLDKENEITEYDKLFNTGEWDVVIDKKKYGDVSLVLKNKKNGVVKLFNSEGKKTHKIEPKTEIQNKKIDYGLDEIYIGY